MGRINIVCFGYRDWSLKLFDALKGIEGVNVSVFPSRDFVNMKVLESLEPGLVLFYGWSWIVPKEIVDSFLCLCLHPSALPKYRGGSPIQNQIINGEKSSAVTIFRMTDGIDDGGICFQQEISLAGNIEEIYERIFQVGLKGTIEVIEKLKADNLEFTVQDENKATVFERRKPAESEISIDEIQQKGASYIYNKIRMLTGPYPHAYITCGDGSRVYLTEAHLERDGV